MLTSVYIVDDHPLVRADLISFLESQDNMRIVGEAGDDETALDEIRILEPDIAMIGLDLPDGNGIELSRAIKQSGLRTHILIWTNFCDRAAMVKKIETGALCCVMRDDEPDGTADAVIAAKVSDPVCYPHFPKSLAPKLTQPAFLTMPLTMQEKEVLGLPMNGRSNKEIAKRPLISARAFKTRIGDILHKFGL